MPLKSLLLICLMTASLSACMSCKKDLGSCPRIFPNAERFAEE